MKATIRLLIADDHAIFRSGMISLLKDYSFIKVEAGASNGKEVFELLKKAEPDIVILDIQMPLMGGFETTKRLKKGYPLIKVIIMSMFFDSYHVSQFFNIGISAYLPKETDIDNLVKAIKTVYETGQYYDEKILQMLQASVNAQEKSTSGINELSLDKSELEILKLICNGKVGKEIANILNISIDNFEYCKKLIRRKTNCYSTAELVKYAIRHGIISVY